MHCQLLCVVSLALAVLANPTPADLAPRQAKGLGAKRGKDNTPLAPFDSNLVPSPPEADEAVPTLVIAPWQLTPNTPKSGPVGPSLEVRPDGTEIARDPRNPLIDYLAKSPKGVQVGTPFGKLSDATGIGGVSVTPKVGGKDGQPIPIVPKGTIVPAIPKFTPKYLEPKQPKAA